MLGFSDTVMDGEIGLRPATDEDDELLFDIYASTRRDEIESFGWDDAQEKAFLRMQFTQRQGAYKLQFPAAEYSVILAESEPVGSLIVERRDDAISLTDIAILPEFAGRGVGSAVIRSLKEEAITLGRPIVLHVDKTNRRAQEFYLSRGFTVTGESQINYSMEWKPDER